MPDADWIRKLCLSFHDATEKLEWGENLCFKVRGKIFAIVDLSEGSLAPVTLKSAPEQFDDLLEIEGIAPAPYVGRYNGFFWNTRTSCAPTNLKPSFASRMNW
jgi:predicted DNA-binding protein (MmcQ/YjbR family)